MGSIFGMVILLIVAVIIMYAVTVPDSLKRFKNIGVTALFGAGLFVGALGAVGYNSSGSCTHAQTVFGTETYKCKTGWYFTGWGFTTEYPHYITVAHSNATDIDGTSVNPPYSVRLADNWNGVVTQTTRFEIPRDRDQFMKMHSTFKGAQALVSRTLRPAVQESLDSVSNLFSMEEYYAGGKRDDYKNEYDDAIKKGRPIVRQVSVLTDSNMSSVGQVAANDLESSQDSSSVGTIESRRVVMEKVIDVDGNPIRKRHDFVPFGITVAQATLENLDPDDRFEDQIQARKDAASRRIVAQEERREQEEQRLLAIQRGQTEIAKSQATAKVEQIKATTDAETQKKLALIKASRQLEEADVSRKTAEVDLERAKIEAESKRVTAEAEAYAKEAILLADGALAQKLDAWVEAQRVWAEAASSLNVPSTVIGGSGDGVNSVNSAQNLMDLLMVNTAKQLSLDPTIAKTEQ